MRDVLAVTALGFSLTVAGLTGEARVLLAGALVALALAGWATRRTRTDAAPVRLPRRPS